MSSLRKHILHPYLAVILAILLVLAFDSVVLANTQRGYPKTSAPKKARAQSKKSRPSKVNRMASAKTKRHSGKKSNSVGLNGKKPKTDSMGAKLGTDFHFNDMAVSGKYQTALDGEVTVEDEKSIHDLIDYRSNFKDRLKRSKEMN